MLRFNDGMEFDTRGELRTEHRSDGWYVTGEGKLLPMRDEKQAREYVERVKALRAGAK
jgi:hypothetical protein